jgi:hypothetical protein
LSTPLSIDLNEFLQRLFDSEGRARHELVESYKEVLRTEQAERLLKVRVQQETFRIKRLKAALDTAYELMKEPEA